jgi:hypothetical protein
MFYGLKKPKDLHVYSEWVVTVLGGGESAVSLLMETAAVETLAGSYEDDNPETKGVGVCQHDQIGLDDIQLHPNKRAFALIRELSDYDMASVQLADLAFDPLLSLICCRLSYMRIPEAIPDDLYGRALYWKEHYNRSGKGTSEHYLEQVAHCFGEEWK